MSRKLLVRIGIGLLVLLMIGAGVAYWKHIHIFVSTDDAYVAGYVGVISARVPGRPGCRGGWPKFWWTTTSTSLPARSW